MVRSEPQIWNAADLVGGHPAIDLINTTGGSTKARDAERLADFPAFVRWSLVAGLLTDDEETLLLEQARIDPETAVSSLAHAQAFRESLHAMLTGYVEAGVFPDRDRQDVEDAVKKTLRVSGLEVTAASAKWRVFGEAWVNLALHRAVLSAHELLLGDDLARLRCCTRCSWLFVDRSRGPARKWCSMATCGNRAKAERHYHAHRGEN